MPDREQGNSKQDEIVDGEIIAELPDETLFTLPPIQSEKSEHLGVPKIESEPVDMGRRQLLLRLGLGGAAALALGGSAALLFGNQNGGKRVVVLPNGAEVKSDGTLDVAQLVEQIDKLQTDLALAEAERDDLSAQLQVVSNELADLRPKLQTAETLNGLWQQLDDIGLDALLAPALQLAVTAFAGVLTVTNLLAAGVGEAQGALDKFIQSLPGPKSGLLWLQTQVQRLAADLQNLATQVQQAVEPVQPYAEMIANFVTWVLDRLPFGVGDKAKAGLEAMNAIVGGLPAIVDGINKDVLDPLIVWFGDDQARNFYGLLLDPVSKKLIEPGRTVESQIGGFQDAFQNKLVTPVQTALDQRAAIRQQISDLQPQPQTGIRSPGGI